MANNKTFLFKFPRKSGIVSVGTLFTAVFPLVGNTLLTFENNFSRNNFGRKYSGQNDSGFITI